MRRTKERARLEDRVAELLNAGVRPVVPGVVNSIGMRLVLIPPGRFRMGSASAEKVPNGDDDPLHEVEITKAFYLGVFPVTQAQWQTVVDSNPSWFCTTGAGKDQVAGLDTSDFPVEQISWDDAVSFCRRLSGRPDERARGWVYRLPTEAEWEYACRAGTSTPFHCGNALSSLQANFDGNYPYGGAEKGSYLKRTSEVGSYRPNAWGLFDMHGNIWEWCSDWYGGVYHGKGPAKDPPGPSGGSERVVRGGGWRDDGRFCQASLRYGGAPSGRSNLLGFRVAAVPQG
jgi:formylglycine-generating enzyme required for sulfatase activity